MTVWSAAASGCDLQRLDVQIADVEDLYTAFFDIVYDPEVVRYEGYSISDSILASDGVQVEVLEQAQQGRIALGISRVQSDQGVDVGASGTLVALDFARVSRELTSGPIYFENGKLMGSETPPLEKDGFEWFGGVFSVR